MFFCRRRCLRHTSNNTKTNNMKMTERTICQTSSVIDRCMRSNRLFGSHDVVVGASVVVVVVVVTGGSAVALIPGCNTQKNIGNILQQYDIAILATLPVSLWLKIRGGISPQEPGNYVATCKANN